MNMIRTAAVVSRLMTGALLLAALAACDSSATPPAAGTPAPTPSPPGGTPSAGPADGPSGQPSTPPAGPPDAGVDAPAPAPDGPSPDRRPLTPVDLGPVMTTAAPPPAPGGIQPPEGMCPFNVKDLDPWFPVTPPLVYFKPLPHPETECPFYVFAFQHFLIATQPAADGKPAFLGWNTIENTFGKHAGEPPPAVPVLTGGVTQAGSRQLLIDQKGKPIYYGLHFNQRFVNFVYQHELTTVDAIRNAPADLKFDEPDIVTLKSAWMLVDDASPPANFIVAKVRVPTFKMVDGKPVEDYSKLRDVTVALIALHVVFTIPGHPEFIWGTFEHVIAGTGISDVAPSARTQPGPGTGPATVISQTDHLLYKAGTTVANSNKTVVNPMFDEATQSFPVSQASHIYRVFRGSLSHQADIDEDVVSLNQNMLARYKTEPRPAAEDKRVNYLMVGTIWLDRPEDSFKLNAELVNDYTDPDIQRNGPESLKSITGGEDRLSSTAMESFTQDGNAFSNCFTCHNTQGATASGVPQVRDSMAEPLLGPKLIGVSHVFNEVLRLKP
jgi:hypothetical protein